MARGTGRSKKQAEVEAATAALEERRWETRHARHATAATRQKEKRSAVMIYSLSLHTVGLVVGLLLVAAHVFALAAPAPTQTFLRTFPRSRFQGTLLLAIGAIWAFWLVRTMDLGEFAKLRPLLTIAVPVGAVLTWHFVDEFLAVPCARHPLPARRRTPARCRVSAPGKFRACSS